MTSAERGAAAPGPKAADRLGGARRFSAEGYSATTIEAIATEAGVSPATVYKVFGTKRAMAGELLTMVDEQAGIEGFRGLLATGTDPWELLATSVQLGRSLFEHSGDVIAAVRGAAEVERDFAEVYAEGRRRHRAGCTSVALRLHTMGALRDGVDATWAAGVISLSTDNDTFDKLTNLFGWTLDECEERLTAQARELLLGPRPRRTTTGRRK